MVAVIGSKSSFTTRDSAFLENTYHAFNNQNDTSSAKELSTYIKRQRPFILSWVSPTDGSVSFSWLSPPKNWNPENKYPLYIQLHGLWSVASNSIEYMTYPFLAAASGSNSFEDGYLLSPWGRGNLWYQGISETDIWECIAALEDIVTIDSTRKYLSGHSMGGYGAWRIASKSPYTWAALGIHAGALWYNGSNLVNSTVAKALKYVPTYFVCGTIDALLSINQVAYNLLEDVGNQHLKFTTFVGGHEYIEENVENMYLWMRNFVNEDMSAVEAAFTANITTGTTPLSVSFSDQSSGSPTSWKWDFNNDGFIDAISQNPTYTFKSSGTYTVKLIVSRIGSTDTIVKTEYIVVSLPTDIDQIVISEKKVYVYPNPISTWAKVMLHNFGSEKIKLEVVGIQGTIISTHDVTGQKSYDLDFSSYARGIYFLKTHSIGQVFINKLILQ
jgi:hypothetical protein